MGRRLDGHGGIAATEGAFELNVLVAIALMVWNAAASWANANAAGRRWLWAKHDSLGRRIPVWAAVVASAAGFTWVYIVSFTAFASAARILDPETAGRAAELGYVVAALPLIGIGLIQTASTWEEFRKAPSWKSYWRVNNHANILRYNWANLRLRFPQAPLNLEAFLVSPGKKDPRGRAVIIAVVIVSLGLLAGTLTTIAVFRAAYRRQAAELFEHRRRSMRDEEVPGRTTRIWIAESLR